MQSEFVKSIYTHQFSSQHDSGVILPLFSYIWAKPQVKAAVAEWTGRHVATG